MSVQFQGKEFTFTQPDGSTFHVKGWGDQHYAVFETLDGHTVLKNPYTGFYEVAQLSKDGTELEPTGTVANDSTSAPSDVPAGVRVSRASAKAKAGMAAAMITSQRRCELRRELRKNVMRATLSVGGPVMAPPTRATVGDFTGLCLLIDFSDDPGTVTQDQVDAFCNHKGYSGFGNNGSVYDYFYDNSLGLFRYTNIVTAYYRASQPKTYYTDPAIPYGTRAKQLIREALDDMKSQGFGFSPLTSDSDGYVYALNVFYAGANTNNWGEGLWPHAWHLDTEYELLPGKVAFDYQFTEIGNELSLGTFCHENGHMVCDYPDLYDYGYESSGVGAYCLMCSSSHDEKNPIQISAYLKRWSGWSTSVTALHDGMEVSLTAGQNEFAIFSKNQTEYFIIENRFRTGRDASLPSSGLAIWHVDELGSNNNEQMTPTRHYELSLEQADNRFDLEHSRHGVGDSEDLYPSGGNSEFTNSSAPGSKWWDGTASNLQIRDISAPDINMGFEVGSPTSSHIVVHYSKPEIEIPDNTAVGIRDVISVPETALITSCSVNVDLTHSYRGDLVVMLTPPSGKPISLHQRQDGGADNLKKTFDISDLPELGSLNGSSPQGVWVLDVKDLARLDVGTLHSWNVELGLEKNTAINVEESPGVRIPDANPTGIERSLPVSETGAISEIEISINISHTYIQDLMINLRSPAGTSVVLHNLEGGSADNLVKTYTAATSPALETLVGEKSQGNWKLQIADFAGQDIGKLNRWAIKLQTT